jgi:GR25 family glycosyltransferase involved in LPS biosynthesis
MSIVDEAYVINMDKETKRLKDFDLEVPWSYIRLPAINGKQINDNITTPNKQFTHDDLLNLKGTVILDYNALIKLKPKYIDDINWMTQGEMGCLLSHVFLWEHLVATPGLHRIAIFEDDARSQLNPTAIDELVTGLYDYMEENNIEEPDILYLGKALDYCIQYKKVWKNVYYSQHPLCLHAYIITKKGAKKLLSRKPYNMAIDLVPIKAIEDGSIKTMVFHPSLYFQDILGTSSSLRSMGQALNITTECLVDQQHISETTMTVIFVALVGFVVVLILFLYLWNPYSI